MHRPVVHRAEPATLAGRDRCRVLIAGCGYVGEALATQLVADGHTVWGLRRMTQGLPELVHPLAADLAEPASLAALPEGLDFVFYTAAADGASDEAYRLAYVDGPRNLLAALAGQGQRPLRVFFTSSTGVYAQAEGEWVDESSPTEPEGYAGRRLLQGERIVREGPFPGTVLRLGGIYGPQRTQAIEQVRSGAAVCVAGPPRWSNRIHRDDCAGALRHLMRLERPDPVYLGVDREPAPLCEIYRWVAAQLGLPTPRVVEEEVPSSRGSRRGRRSNKRCRSDRLVGSGYRFLYPTYREGLGALLRTGAAGER